VLRVGFSSLLLLLVACGGRYESNPAGADESGSAGATTGSSAGSAATTPPGPSGSAGSDQLGPCQRQQAAYLGYRQQLVEDFEPFGCQADVDCLSFYDRTTCDPVCTLISTGARRGLIDGLNTYAISNCNRECLVAPLPACPAPPPARCVMGRCQ
jgi:hypothetical protein